ncbi:MAG: ATP-binding cassette domain-containing protein [Halioglobus sp.]
MPVLQTYNISHHFDNGETLLQSLSCSMTEHRVGLVGRNGVGKSVFASILSGEILPSSGTVTRPGSFSWYRQQPSQFLSGQRSIAQFLGIDYTLKAIKHIELGDCADHWFDEVNEQWELPAKLATQLKQMGLPHDPDFPCALLSGGQLALLQLWQLFESDVELLILDEPSNHLDSNSRQWLIRSMQAFKGAILLISHDRTLLREMEEIWELSELGLKAFGGNYDHYAEQKRKELHAVERQLASVEKQKKNLARQAQGNREKAEQRAAQGIKLRKAGSQPKMLLDAKKDKATARASSRSKNEQLRHDHLCEKEQTLITRKEQVKTQKLHFSAGHSRSRNVISMLEVVLPFGCDQPITLQVRADDKVHLMGNNGSGKSTLLKTLMGELSVQAGESRVNTPLYYLDQHFGAINPTLSLLDNLMLKCAGIQESQARTLLAGIGFRRDTVSRLGAMLSGGEKMKLAMLIVSHQPTQPLLLLDEPDNHLDLTASNLLARALHDYRGGFILVSHDLDFALESGVVRQIDLDTNN